MMNIYEELVSASACISMDFKSFLEEGNLAEKAKIMNRIIENNDRVMKMAKELQEKSKSIYEILKDIYPVSLGEGFEAYKRGLAEGAGSSWDKQANVDDIMADKW
jgi:hypothetical protein